MSQSCLAKASGLTPAAVSQIENGNREPSLSSILAIMSVIPASFEKLCGLPERSEKEYLLGQILKLRKNKKAAN